jgi:hypothetical protein
MNILMLAVISASITITPGIALAKGQDSFRQGGASFVYSIRNIDGVRVLEGVDTSTQRHFRLRIRNGKVRGFVDGMAVSFKAPVAQPIDSVKVAAR